MALFGRSCTTSYQSAIATLALSCTIRRLIVISAYVHFLAFLSFFIWFESFFSRSTTWKQNENSLNKNCDVKIGFIFFKFLLSPKQ